MDDAAEDLLSDINVSQDDGSFGGPRGYGAVIGWGADG
jgi:hypothetical protein